MPKEVWTPAKDAAEVLDRVEAGLRSELERHDGSLGIYTARVLCETPALAEAFVAAYKGAIVACGDPLIAWPAAEAGDLVDVPIHVFRLEAEGADVRLTMAFAAEW